MPAGAFQVQTQRRCKKQQHRAACGAIEEPRGRGGSAANSHEVAAVPERIVSQPAPREAGHGLVAADAARPVADLVIALGHGEQVAHGPIADARGAILWIRKVRDEVDADRRDEDEQGGGPAFMPHQVRRPQERRAFDCRRDPKPNASPQSMLSDQSKAADDDKRCHDEVGLLVGNRIEAA